tara:strand:- start:108 stop:1103 length:996 start_codon:yes stop_codon:yes gene_type:complete
MVEVVFIEKGKVDSEFSEALKKEFSLFKPGDKVAVKLHMGEKGNKFYLKPRFVKIVVDVLKGLNLRPFLFDSLVIYPGGRDSVDKYYKTAIEHGFTEEKTGCPIVVSDDFIVVKTEHLDVEVCKELVDADGLLVLTHVKGHSCSGFGGAIKNLGMGGVSVKTKREIHSFAKPELAGDCVGCGVCVKACPMQTISLKDGKVVFDYSGCWGCDVCVDACPSKVLKPQVATFDRLIAEGTSAVLKNRKKVYFVNFLWDMTKLCDCCSDAGDIVLDDIGIVLGDSIVAVEKASLDLINKKAGKDLFKEIHKKSPLKHIEEAEKLGLGSLSYRMVS